MPVAGGTQFINPQDIIAKAQIIQGMKVADLGCGGLGYFVLPIAKIVGKEGKVYGVDILKTALEGVKSKARLAGLNNVETVWANLEKTGSTNIPEKSLDVALLINVLFQNKNKAELLKEAVRLVKPGGKIMVVDWKKISVPVGPHIDLRIDSSEVKQVGEKLNLKLVEETDFGQYFWGLIFTK